MRKVHGQTKVNRGKHTLVYRALLLAISFGFFLLTIQPVIDTGSRWLSIGDSNLQRWRTDLDTELKQQSWALAEQFFQDKTVARVITDGFALPDASHPSETSSNSVRDRHPIVGEMFVSTGVVTFSPQTPAPLAKVLQPILQRALNGNTLPPDAIAVFEFRRGGSPYQVFYKPARARGTSTAAGIGFVSDLDWVRKGLFLKTWNSVNNGQYAQWGISSEMKILMLQDVEPKALAAASPQAFNRPEQLFSFWNLHLSEEWIANERRSVGKALISTVVFLVMFLSLVGIGVFEVSKTYRERNFVQLRSAVIDQVSHQLKTPLTLISLYAETLLAQEDAPLEERRTYYEIIARESARLGDTVDRVLEFSRIERGDRKYKFERGDLNNVIRHTIDMYTPWLKRSGFKLESRLAPDLPPVDLDPEAVSHAVLNLIDNARKYSGDSRYIGVDTYANTSGVVVEVRDNGVGMAPDEHDAIFQEFYRSPKTAGERGSGLGLFLVKYIADKHGASIQVDSTVGVGSRFRLIFPAAKPDSTAGAHLEPPVAAPKLS